MIGISLQGPNLRFDIVEYIKKLRNAGVSQDVAEIQAQGIEYVLEQTRQEVKQGFEDKELATKGDMFLIKQELELKIEQVRAGIEQVRADLKTELHKSKYDLVIWVGGLFVASGLIQHFFK